MTWIAALEVAGVDVTGMHREFSAARIEHRHRFEETMEEDPAATAEQIADRVRDGSLLYRP